LILEKLGAANLRVRKKEKIRLFEREFVNIKELKLKMKHQKKCPFVLKSNAERTTH